MTGAITAVAATLVLAGGASLGGSGGDAPAAEVPTCDLGGPAALSAVAPPALAALGATQAWQHSTGEGVVVAIVDSGIDAANPHLADAVLPGVNLVVDGADAGGRADTDGHGTAVAGVIAARRVDGSQVVGLAPGAHLLPVRTYRDRSDQSVRAGLGPDGDRLAQGIRYAADAGAQIINVSQSMPQDTDALRAAVEYAGHAGALVVASAGNRATATNESDGLRYPAAYPGVLGVAAQGAQGVVTEASIHGAHVGVSAPGSYVVTTYPGGGDCMITGAEASSSMATAYTSAAAALVAAQWPQESPAQWLYRLEATALRPVPAQRDDWNGWGAIQPVDALEFAIDGSAPGPMPPGLPPRTPAVPPQREVSAAPSLAPPSDSIAAALLATGVAAVAAALLALGALLRHRRRAEVS